MGIGIYEVPGRWLEKVGKTSWHGYRKFITWDENVRWYVESMVGQTFIGTSGAYAPVAVKVRGSDSEVEGLSYIHAWYETKRMLGRARIRIISSATVRDAFFALDENDQQIAGPDPTEPNESVVVKGEDYIIEHTPEVIVQMAMPTKGYNPLAIAALTGKVNRRSISLLGAKAGTMRITNVDQYQTFLDDLVYLNVHMLYNPGGWLSQMQINSGAWCLKRKPVFASDGTTIIKWDTFRVFTPRMKWVGDKLVADPAKSGRSAYLVADFTILNGLMYWEIVK
jgi:hypothetical protein